MNKRSETLQAVRSAIHTFRFTPQELSFPQAHNFFALISCMEDFPISLSHTKLCILFYLHHYDPATRAELRLFIPKDDSRISRSIADLTTQGYISAKEKTLSLTPSGLTLITDFLAHYFSKIDALHRYAEAIHSCANATSTSSNTTL